MAAYTKLADVLPDGVHLHLRESEYFGQDALGSSDLIRLHHHKHGWWWQSRHNPDAAPRSTKEQTYGSALHALMLEGVDAYEDRFLVLPERSPEAVETIDEMIAALAAAGLNVKFPGAGTWKKDDWKLAMRRNLPEVQCWPNVQDDFDAEKAERGGGVSIIGAVEDRMLRLMYDVARGNEEIAGLLAGGRDEPPLAEVSILKTLDDGTRRRWRLDRLFARFTMDLKSLGNWSGRPLQFAVGDHLARGGHDIQRADYDEGRKALGEFVLDRFQVYGGSVEERDWLRRLVDATHAEGGWDWVWLYYQKPEPTGRAPVLMPVVDYRFVSLAGGEVRDGDLYRVGRAKADRALAFYRHCRDQFGLDRPWAHVEELHYTDQAFNPAIALPHWIGEADPAEESAYV